ncbi:MAG: TetR/AcrR family transcriptional regulator [Deltaproteobacteria bacterium]|nr:TetR/AcrR family transcriptional regulator [Deltaproteobacteria bacterium]
MEPDLGTPPSGRTGNIDNARPLPAGERPDGRLRKGAETAERILNVAEELFAEKGYAGTTLRDIATRAKIRNPSIYNHFDGKENLYLAVLERGLRPMWELFQQLAIRANQSDELDLQVVDGLMDLLAEHPNLPNLMQHEALSGGERLHARLAEWVQPMFDAAAGIVTHSPGNRWREGQTTLLVLALYNMIAGYFTMAPLYKVIRGEDLLEEEMRDKQRQLLHEIIGLLFSEENKT